MERSPSGERCNGITAETREKAMTYTFIGLVDGGIAGRQVDASFAEVADLMECLRCSGEYPEEKPCQGECTTTTFLRDLAEVGHATLVEGDEYGTSVSIAYSN